MAVRTRGNEHGIGLFLLLGRAVATLEHQVQRRGAIVVVHVGACAWAQTPAEPNPTINTNNSCLQPAVAQRGSAGGWDLFRSTHYEFAMI